MKLFRFKTLFYGFFLSLGIFLGALTSFAQEEQRYFYDALGRLIAVVDEQGNTAFYDYDAVGNLLSIARSGPPTITGITPSLVDAGTSFDITISGERFFDAAVTTSNPEIQIDNVVTVSHTEITATFTIPNPTTFGTTTVTITDLGRTSSIIIEIQQPTPVIVQLDPNIGGVGGDFAVIDGQGFGTKAGSNLVTFEGAGGTRLVVSEVISEGKTSIRIRVPTGVETGPVTVEVGGLISNGVSFQPLTLTSITSTAALGVPTNPINPSANVDQTIPVQGIGFSSTPGFETQLVFPVLKDTGQTEVRKARLTNINPNGETAEVPIPSTLGGGDEVTTGLVTIEKRDVGPGLGSVQFQIVPTIDSFSVPSGGTLSPGVVITLSGSGFAQGLTTVSFPGVSNPVAGGDVDGVNRLMEVTVPTGVTLGPLTVTTNGGTSNELQLSAPVITTLIANASVGTPLDLGQPSANIGDVITITGSGFNTSTEILFLTFDSTNDLSPRPYSPDQISPDSLSLTVTVPQAAVTGPVVIRDGVTLFESNSLNLQIVPTIGSQSGAVVPGQGISVQGSGFEPGASTVQFSGVSQPVLAGDQEIINTLGGTLTVTVPTGVDPSGTIEVITNGGTSNSFQLSGPPPGVEIEPNDDPASATPIQIGDSISGVIDPAGDLDYYRFDVTDGTFVRIIFTDLGGDLKLIDLLDQDGTTILETDSFLIPWLFESSGTFYIRIRNANATVGGPGEFYTFELQPAVGSETEPNNDSAGANPLNVDPFEFTFENVVTGTVDPAGDVDFYQFNVPLIIDSTPLPIFIVLGLNNPNPNFVPRITVLDSDGVTVLFSEITNFTLFSPPQEGTYFLKLESDNGLGGPDFFYYVSLSTCDIGC